MGTMIIVIMDNANGSGFSTKFSTKVSLDWDRPHSKTLDRVKSKNLERDDTDHE